MIDDIVAFIMANTTYTDADKMREFVQAHMKYKTCVVAMDEGRVVGFLRFNITKSDECRVLDCIVNDKFKGCGLIWDMTERAHAIWPDVRWIEFERGYDDGKTVKKIKRYDLNKIMRRVTKCCV